MGVLTMRYLGPFSWWSFNRLVAMTQEEEARWKTAGKPWKKSEEWMWRTMLSNESRQKIIDEHNRLVEACEKTPLPERCAYRPNGPFMDDLAYLPDHKWAAMPSWQNARYVECLACGKQFQPWIEAGKPSYFPHPEIIRIERAWGMRF